MRTNIKKIVATGLMFTAIASSFIAEAAWTGVAVKRTTAYTDSALTRKNGVEYVDAGDTITVLQEAGNAYYVRYPLARGGFKERWVSKDVFGSTANSTPRTVTPTVGYSYQQWQGYSPNRLTAYTNAALTARNANEWVGAGDTVTVLNESGNAYYVRYPLMNGGTKDRWVSKNGIQRPGNGNVGTVTASAAAKAVSAAITSQAASYTQWQGYSPNRLTAYTNAALTARNANEWVGAGDTVTVLNESGNAYYVRYPLTRGGYKDRWVSKNGIQRPGNGNVGTTTASAAAKAMSAAINSPAANYTQWQGYSPNRLTAYTNAALTARNANEWVGAGDTVTVLNESGNAYYVRYPLMNGGTKDRWVSKNGIQRPGNGNVGAATASAAAKAMSAAINSPAANYTQWQGYSPNRLTAYTNAALTARNANEWVGAGDTVTVLNESGNAYYVRYPLMNGGTKDRWVSKNGIQRSGNGNVGTATVSAAAKAMSAAITSQAANYTQWQGYSPNRLTAYTNAALTSRNANEWVGAGDTVTVLNESGNAYYVRYPLTRGGYKDRWVSKRGIQRNGATQSNGIRENGMDQSLSQRTAMKNAAQNLSRNAGTVSNYQQWQGYCPNRLTAYTNSALTTRNANEWVGAGDTVTVLKEEGNAYYVSYPLLKGGTKERWVKKSGIQKPNAISNVNQNMQRQNNSKVVNVHSNYIWPIPNHFNVNTIYYYMNSNGADGKKGGTHSCRYFEDGKTTGKPYGLDIRAAVGTEIQAIANGKVIESQYIYPKPGRTRSFGNIIVIEHEGGKKSLYAHLSERFVETGQEVTQGQVIGKTGDTHNQSEHFHFELSWQNPYEYYLEQNLSFTYDGDNPAHYTCNRVWVGSTTYAQRKAMNL